MVEDFSFKTDSSFFNFLIGSMKLKNNPHSSMTLMLVDLNNFIKNHVTAKSSDLTLCLVFRITQYIPTSGKYWTLYNIFIVMLLLLW